MPITFPITLEVEVKWPEGEKALHHIAHDLHHIRLALDTIAADVSGQPQINFTIGPIREQE